MRYFYECGICECLHPCGYTGDCRDDTQRFALDEVESQFGQDNVTVVPMDEADDYPVADQTLGFQDLKSEFNMAFDGDAWGNTMVWWFTVAGEMFTRGKRIPDEWNYRPGVCAKEFGRWETEVCEEATDEALLQFGKLLYRYAARLKQAGKDY